MGDTPLPSRTHPDTLRSNTSPPAGTVANFAQGKSVYVVDVPSYELYRSMLYALGAESVSNKMLAHVNVVLHGGADAPEKARKKYPQAAYVPAKSVLPLFRAEVHSFGAFVQALAKHGFRVRNPSDEGDAHFDYFALPLHEGSLHATLWRYLDTSEFIRRFVRKAHHPRDERQPEYVEFVVQTPAGAVPWYYAWHVDAWRRVHAQRGDGNYPLEIKGEQLLAVEPVFWSESTGLYFFDEPHIDAVNGLFIQAGIDARSGEVNGVAISRAWT